MGMTRAAQFPMASDALGIFLGHLKGHRSGYQLFMWSPRNHENVVGLQVEGHLSHFPPAIHFPCDHFATRDSRLATPTCRDCGSHFPRKTARMGPGSARARVAAKAREFYFLGSMFIWTVIFWLFVALRSWTSFFFFLDGCRPDI